jgi:hypothetical protein
MQDRAENVSGGQNTRMTQLAVRYRSVEGELAHLRQLVECANEHAKVVWRNGVAHVEITPPEVFVALVDALTGGEPS